MRHIEGFVDTVIVLSTFYREMLFGKNMGDGQGTYEAFYSNGLTPFSTLEEARTAKLELVERQHEDREFGRIGIARILMDLAETEGEVYDLEGETSLLVVTRTSIISGRFDYHMYGQLVEGRMIDGHINGTPLESNGYQPISDFKLALMMARDTSRQKGWTNLAVFQLDRLNEAS